MITDDQIKKLCFLTAIIGCIGIILTSIYLGPENAKIYQINRDMIGKIIETSGAIDKISTKEGHIFIQLREGNEKISVVMFERTARTQKYVYELKEGMNITVIGKVLLYKNEIEIQANSILPKDY